MGGASAGETMVRKRIGPSGGSASGPKGEAASSPVARVRAKT